MFPLRNALLLFACALIGLGHARAQEPSRHKPDDPRQTLKTVTDLGVVGAETATQPDEDAASASELLETLPPPPFAPLWAGPFGPIAYPYTPLYHAGGARLRHGELDFAYRLGRATERYRQDAWELRRRLTERHGVAPPIEPDYPYEGTYGAGVGWYGDYGYGLAPGFYEIGRQLEYYRQQELYLREQLTLATYEDLLRIGIAYFREGGYGLAARALSAAAEKNHEDAGCRVLACQALVATGSYKKALAHFRRAVELQPLLLNLPIDLRDEYGLGLQKDYDEHVARLADYCEAHPRNANAWLLLAGQKLLSSNPGEAGPPLRRARSLTPRDSLFRQLWNAAEPMLDEVD